MGTDLEALRRRDLAGATELRLNAGLAEFPREIFGLTDRLEVLDLSGNLLDRLPEDMGRLHIRDRGEGHRLRRATMLTSATQPIAFTTVSGTTARI
jgi:hypothetical protein